MNGLTSTLSRLTVSCSLLRRSAPIIHARSISATPVMLRTVPIRQGTKYAMLNSDIMTGTVGADSYYTVRTEDVDRHLPSSHTLKELFNGVPYDELPIAYIKATRNNTLIHVYDATEGFKHARKKTTMAGQTTGVAAAQKLLRRGVQMIRVVVNGIGPGRMSSVKGMSTSGIHVVSISDRTKLPELGKRPRKIRRV